MAGQVWNRCTETDTTSLQLPFFVPDYLSSWPTSEHERFEKEKQRQRPVRNGYLVTVGAGANVHRNHARLIEDEGESVRAYEYVARPKLRPLR